MIFEYYCLQKCKANCCKGWTIFTTIKDIERIAEFTKKEPKKFSKFLKIPDWEYDKYFSETNFHFYSLSISRKVLQLKKRNDKCIFLKRNKCTIYPVRPYICRLFPFWFIKKGNNFRVSISAGYEDVCIIPKETLNSYRDNNKDTLLKLIRTYYKEIEDYKVNILSFVKEHYGKRI